MTGKTPVKKDNNEQKDKDKQKSVAYERGQLVAFFKRVSQGERKTATDADRKLAGDALVSFNSMDGADKQEFTTRFINNKGKGMGWVKNYLEEFSQKRRTNETMTEGYKTRIL